MLTLDHTIVPSKDKEAGVRFMSKMLGIEYQGAWGHFAPLKLNDTLSFDWDTKDEFDARHYALLASDEEFDAILAASRPRASPTAAVRAPIKTWRSTTGTRAAASTSRTSTSTSGKSSPTPT